MRFETDFQMKVRDALAARDEPEAQHLLASVYWSMLVSLFAIIVAASVAYGLWEFVWAPADDEMIVSARPQAAFTRTELQKTLQGFDERQERFDERMVAPVSVKDPSK
ncbi:hypothetical protein A3A38_02565 [Candidatus Kaiserbacteria bacterium RIFCSPLOWO2_01_FULL_53_17]|uniref:Uncharacterized protein n=1 Tax=Candidatus Kaiserbacteria bacterium RIFCSPLOWO2_01_FULL_53_17 TaxID=1798511 RepID=A0A1F6EGP9_9BACT|nr:MAG: hypothetical protein A3A38_02565 [Candidatus Kaiserbacteria bacterium RIFCSPLOWO2_01_FULL_53_17]